MLSVLSSQLATRRVVLASQSPRRLEILRECGLTFDVIPSTFEENLPKDQFPTPEHYVLENAKQKALEVVQRTFTSPSTIIGTDTSAVAAASATATALPFVVIGCDTVVVHNGAILEKPKDEQDAFAMLTQLSGKTHEVYSGVALVTSVRGSNRPHLFCEKTTVTFGPLEPEDIRAYIQTGEPMDKAGAYGIQGRARCFIQELHGCHNNVMGFPVQRFCSELKQLAFRNEL